jgi:hypothetical protein
VLHDRVVASEYRGLSAPDKHDVRIAGCADDRVGVGFDEDIALGPAGKVAVLVV